MAYNILLRPYIIFLASNTALNLTAAHTSHNSPIRYLTLAFLALCAYILPRSLASFSQTTGWAGRVPAGSMFWNIVSCFDRLILRGWDYENYGPREASNDEKTGQKTHVQSKPYPGTRGDFGKEAIASARGVELWWQVKGVPHFSRIDPYFVPSRAAFIAVQATTAVLCYYIQNLTVEVVFAVDPTYITPERVPLFARLSEVSLAELQVRVVSSIGFWVLQFCMIQFFYSIAGTISAIRNPKDIHLWRPIYGSFEDAYTIRNFWGKTWHQNLRSGLEGVSNFFTHDILQLPHKGLLQRYTKVLSSFALSGLMHNAADTGGGMLWRESGAMQFFCMQALGIIIEDGVQALYRQFFKRKPSVVERTIGYVWVVLFVVWTTPAWVFPAFADRRKEDAYLSFAAIKPVFSGR